MFSETKIGDVFWRYVIRLKNWNGLDKEMPFSKNIAGITDSASIPDRVMGGFVKNLAALEYDSG